jgi:hypothetical protein
MPRMSRQDELEEIQAISYARNQVIYEGRKNSLVEWTLSPEWTTVPKSRPQTPIAGEINVRHAASD